MERPNELNQEYDPDNLLTKEEYDKLKPDFTETEKKYELDLRDSDLEDDDPREIYY